MTLHHALVSLLLLGATPSLAAGRVPYGGELRVAHTGPAEPGDPALADTPIEATLLGLVSRPACHLAPDGHLSPGLAREPSRPSAQVVRLGLPSPAQAQALVRAWARLTGAEAPSPYRALLFPLRGEGRQLSATSDTLEMALAFPWPDLERALCHPALAPPRSAPAALGPFSAAGSNTVEARLAWTEGRPYVDRVRLLPTDERGLSRLWSTHETQVALGVLSDGGTVSGAALYATYLAWSPRRVPPDFRQAVESAVDREDLTRLFVRGPAVPMPNLLPPALLPPTPGVRPTPPEPQAGRKVTLLYDVGNEDQRAVAERLQVKLHDRGYNVALEPLPRAELRARWAKGDYELMLHSLLLPPVPGPALAVVLDAAGRKDLLGVELPRIGALTDPEARDAKVRERALALAPSVPLLPLYAQGLALRAAPEVGGLVFDAQGLPVLDGVWLQPAQAGVPGARR
ncbi:peptide ABC transporter substrate-binding protein [Vitiosangium sp. GDMCC 1.1324]|uniref:peptide ABC transporter substrate-binding protein n=1 Tax=Vitiosangium sp. (strain GDMCC 1.1324) TaxID=2138576 RepID=UPI000D36A9C0|nr:peptide ABC transporter substrate-binding protein [Vitiosangium sp. GDMCC 1.1324]PTL78713.1 peptide ABC transporter substrate-binding protein [Vitiosangium sp. GDMCC 1.1324]